MKIKVGQYELVTTEEFKTEKEAVTRFLEHFPDANPEKVKTKVKPYFIKDAKVSGKSSKTSSESTSANAEDNSTGASKKQLGRNK